MGRPKRGNKQRLSLLPTQKEVRRYNSKESVVKKSTDGLTVVRRKAPYPQVRVDDSGPSSSCAFEATPRFLYIGSTPFITGRDTSHGDCVAVDCEMVGTGLKGSVSMLGRCAVVNHHGHVLYETMVAPLAPVTDYRTPFSGIRKRDLKGAPSFLTVQEKVQELLRGRILIGHDIHNDLEVLDIRHPQKNIRDTSRYTFCPFKRNTKGARSKLKTMFMRLTGVEIQKGEHCPIEDAQAAMVLYQRNKEVWEASLIYP